MPGIAGLEVYPLLRDGTREVPVRFATPEPATVRAPRLPGSHAVLGKPFAVDDLLGVATKMKGKPNPGIERG